MTTKTLSKQDIDILIECVKTTISSRAKTIQTNIDSCSCQFCWAIAGEMVDEFELLNKLEELCGEEEK